VCLPEVAVVLQVAEAAVVLAVAEALINQTMKAETS
jgi:hypothetical protein